MTEDEKKEAWKGIMNVAAAFAAGYIKAQWKAEREAYSREIWEMLDMDGKRARARKRLIVLIVAIASLGALAGFVTAQMLKL